MQDLGSLGGVVGFVEEMNSRGQVIGGSSTAANPTACYLVPNQRARRCHSLRGEIASVDQATSTPT